MHGNSNFSHTSSGTEGRLKSERLNRLLLLNNEIEYELVSALYNTGGHFVSYARFPEVQPARAGLYRYDDKDGMAKMVSGIDSRRNPVMLIYKAKAWK